MVEVELGGGCRARGSGQGSGGSLHVWQLAQYPVLNVRQSIVYVDTFMSRADRSDSHTHTFTHTHICMYVYSERERPQVENI